ncbi:MAG: HAD family phosphatase [Methylacidiphilales bacterium]|nr:HAD family phosphatase [Candidatus Methylacidiphilales bacterium]
MNKLALFDLDDTLINGDSDWLWCEFLIEKGVLSADFRTINDDFYYKYEQGTLNPTEYLEFVLSPLKNTPESKWYSIREEYINKIIKPLILRKVKQFVTWHKDQGMTVIIITATNRFITEPIANIFEVDHLIASEYEINQGLVTGRPSGIPNFKEGKVKNLSLWLEKQGLELSQLYSVFYSDSPNDLPLLQLVSKPVATNPSKKLHEHAKEQGWSIIHFWDTH